MDAFTEAQRAQKAAQRDIDSVAGAKRKAALDTRTDPNREAVERARREGWTQTQR